MAPPTPNSDSPFAADVRSQVVDLAARLRRLAGERAVRRLASELRAERSNVEDPAPWIAAAFGLADTRQVAPLAFNQADRAVRRLGRLSPAARLTALRSGFGGPRNPALPLVLIDEACRHLGSDPRDSLAWLDLAAEALRLLAANLFPARALLPHRFRLAAHRANTLRVLGELPAADRIFRQLAADPWRPKLARHCDIGELLSLEASLRIDQRRWRAAEDLLAGAESAYRAAGDDVGVSKVLLKRGTVAEYSGNSEAALHHYREAVENLDPAAEPILYFTSRHNEASALASLARPAEARSVLDECMPLISNLEAPATHNHCRWTRARIAGLEGRLAEAAAALEEVCSGYLALRRPYFAAFVLLDAAELHLAQGHWAEVKELAGRLEAVFAVRGVHAEAHKALVLFQEAARGEALTAEFLGRVRHYLLVGRNDPRFRFDAGRPTQHHQG